MRIVWDRWGGGTQLLKSEVRFSNAASLDGPLARRLIEKYDARITIANPSSKMKKAKIEKTEDWLENVVCCDSPFEVHGLDFDLHFISQGAENFRFLGSNDISHNMWTYWHLSHLNCPSIYLQFDAYTYLWLPAETRGFPAAAYGANMREIFRNNICIMVAGCNPALIETHGYSHVKGFVDIVTWEHDIHSVAREILIDQELPFNYQAEPSIIFCGADRNKGSRLQSIKNIAAHLKYMKIFLYGKWNESDASDTIKIGGTLPSEQLLPTYNKHRFTLLIGNEMYNAYGAYTIRLYEVLAAGCIPIIDETWIDCLKRAFTDEGMQLLYKLSYKDPKEVNDIVYRILDYSLDNQKKIVDTLRKSIKTVITDDYVDAELDRTINIAKARPKRTESEIEDLVLTVLRRMYEADKTSKLSRLREAANQNARDRFNLYYRDGFKGFYSIEKMKSDYAFESTNLPDELLKQYFFRG